MTINHGSPWDLGIPHGQILRCPASGAIHWAFLGCRRSSAGETIHKRVGFWQWLSHSIYPARKLHLTDLTMEKKKIYLSITHGQLGFTNITHGDNCCKYSLGRREWRSCWEVFFWSIVFHRVLVSGIFSSSKPPFSERAMHITMKQQGAFGRCPLPRLPQGRIG